MNKATNNYQYLLDLIALSTSNVGYAVELQVIIFYHLCLYHGGIDVGRSR